MPTRGKRAALEQWLDSARPARIGEMEFVEIADSLAPLSQSYLRKLLRECGVPLHPMVEGVRQTNLDELEASLLALLIEYSHAEHARQLAVRRLVVEAKDHARLALRKIDEPEKRRAKEEMILWLMTWLENPPLFAEWVRLRRALAR